MTALFLASVRSTISFVSVSSIFHSIVSNLKQYIVIQPPRTAIFIWLLFSIELYIYQFHPYLKDTWLQYFSWTNKSTYQSKVYTTLSTTGNYSHVFNFTLNPHLSRTGCSTKLSRSLICSIYIYIFDVPASFLSIAVYSVFAGEGTRYSVTRQPLYPPTTSVFEIDSSDSRCPHHDLLRKSKEAGCGDC